MRRFGSAVTEVGRQAQRRTPLTPGSSAIVVAVQPAMRWRKSLSRATRAGVILAAFGCSEAPTPAAPIVTLPAAGTDEPQGPVLARGAALRGEFDPTFGDGGAVLLERAPGEQRIDALTILPDGAIAAAGYADFDGETDVAATRVTPDGHLDSHFGDGGFVRVGSTHGFGGAIAHDAAGRLLVAGYFHRSNGTDLVIGRLDDQGQLDPSFGDHGLVTHDAGPRDQPHALFVRSDGGIVVVGYHAGKRNAALALRADGSLDRHFGEEGVARFGRGEGRGNAYATAAVMGPDAAVVAGGYLANEHRGFVARIDARGRPDARFGEDGLVLLEAPPMSSAWAVALDADGRVLLGGQTDAGPAVVVRFTARGELDRTWGSGGVARADPHGDDQFYALLCDAGGRVVGVGFRGLADDARALVARFTPAGVLDPTFGQGGMRLRTFGGGTFLFDAAWDHQGRLVTGGDVWNHEQSRMLVVRMR